MTTTLILNQIPRFPAHVRATNGLAAIIENGVDVLIVPSYGDLVPVPAVTKPATTYFMAWDAEIDYYQSISFDQLAENLSERVLGQTLTAQIDLVMAANQAIYFTSPTVAVAYDLSNFVRGISGSADSASFRASIGLGNVSNTSDANKPVSTAQQQALDLKANAADVYGKTVTYTKTEVDGKITQGTTQGPQLQGFAVGLGLSTNAADSANDVDVAVGAAAADASPFYLMQLTSPLTKRLDAAWAAGSNQGCLDTGTVLSSGTYFFFEIQRSDTLATEILASLSSTAPTMPANYDRKRLIGFVYRSSSVNGPPIMKKDGSFTSDQLVFANSSAVSVSHGLGAKPSKVRARIVCLVSEGGYSVGDEIHLSTQWGTFSTSVKGNALSANATTITFAVYIQMNVAAKSGSTDISITPANWRVILEADL